MNKNSYSLIEFTLVLGCLLVASYLTISYYFFSDQELLRVELGLLAQTLSFLQQKAIALNQEQFLSIDVVKNKYSYYEENKIITYTLHRNFMFGFINNVKGPPARPHTVIVHPVTCESNKQKTNTIKIRVDGKATSGSIYLTDIKKRIMGAVTVPPHQYAYIRIYEYTNEHWLLVIKAPRGLIT
jgi:hypothetical protein